MIRHGRILERFRRTTRGRRAIANIFELWVALAGIISGAIFFYSPASIDNNALAQTIGYAFSAFTVVLYLIAGGLVWAGLLRPQPRWEITGLWLMGTATGSNGIAIVSVFGVRGIAFSATLLSFMAASWIRALVVQSDISKLIRKLDDASDAGTRA